QNSKNGWEISSFIIILRKWVLKKSDRIITKFSNAIMIFS
ncbi:uncharacterized protein METZ01_LOCUS58598, partial [marine metagenome]